MRIPNKKAHFNYHIHESMEAGVVLTGAEVKSIRAGRVDLSESFARIQNGEAWLKNAYIFPYLGAAKDYDPRHDRKLLLHKHQIESLVGKTAKAGMTLIPLAFYQAHNLIKVELGIASAKQKHDKRRDIKEKDELLRIQQEL